MTPDRWERLAGRFDELRARAPEERRAALEGLRAADPELANDLERLLAADVRAGGFLDAPLDIAAAADIGASPPELDTGATVGRYRIVREIGRGGMGVVFLAERADGAFEQRVALKLVHAGPTGGPEHHAFRQERQILAGLDHPNIARLIDGGVTDAGRPYFVMEYVDGVSLTGYSQDHGLDVPARIRLFQDVCAAVAAAHRHLVVHRDLKPSNILVTAEGHVKLLDFGIAKLIAPTAPRSAHTLASALTPDYAAPEQFRSGPTTTATDVYALGVVLYELLTGLHPYRPSTSTEPPTSTRFAEPRRPSAAARELDPGGSLERTLTGDLDTIVLMALKTEPHRRYPSADALGEDLGRYLAHEPIAARRDSRAYRVRRFIRRHAVGVAASAIVALSLVGGLVATTWQARVAAEQARRAEAAQAFLADVFRVSDPSESVGQTVTAREILDFARRRIDSELGETPALQADLLTEIGRIYTQLGLYRQAAPMLERALALHQSLGSDDSARAETLDALGVLQTRQGDQTGASTALSEALALRRSRGSPAEMATTLSHVAELELQRQNPAGAEQAATEALRLRTGLLGQDHPLVAESLALLAETARIREDVETAITLDRQALSLRRARYGDDHPDVIRSVASVARNLVLTGDRNQAEDLYRSALLSARRTLGPDHPDTLSLLGDLGTTMADEGKLLAGETMLREALEARQLRVGTNHTSLLANLHALVSANRQLNRRDDAERFARQALTIAESRFGPDHRATAQTLTDLGTVLVQTGEFAEAESVLRRAARIVRATAANRGNGGQALTMLRADTTFALGRALRLTKRASDAEPLLREAVATRRALWGGGHPATAEATRELGECLRALGRNAEATALLEQAPAPDPGPRQQRR